MKLKHFDRLQHYYLDKIWLKKNDGSDLPAILEKYIDFTAGELSADAFIEALHYKLAEYPAVDPDNGVWRTWGFVQPFHGQPDDFYDGQDDSSIDAVYVPSLAVEIPETSDVVICVEKRERVLPSSAINDKLFERAKAMQEREQRELNRQDYAILKDEIIASMLKTAPVRRSRIYVMMSGHDLYVFTSSQKAAEETNALIRTAFSSLPTVPAFVDEKALKRFFKQVLLRDEDVCRVFTAGNNFKLKNDEGEVITVKDGDPDEKRYSELLQSGFMPVELEFLIVPKDRMHQYVWVKMNHKGDVKAIFTNVRPEDEEDGTEFDTQYERGSDGFQSKMAELWVWRRVIHHFAAEMYNLPDVRVRRTELEDMIDGDDIWEAENKNPEPQTAEAVEVDDEGMWETEDDDNDI